jgi:hypothetical protein
MSTKSKEPIEIGKGSMQQEFMIASAVALAFALGLWSTGIQIASAQQMDTINASLEVPAPISKVWNIVSDVDKDPPVLVWR